MKPEDPQPTELEEASAKFEASLEQCRHMVADYRAKLAPGGKRRGPLVAADDASGERKA